MHPLRQPLWADFRGVYGRASAALAVTRPTLAVAPTRRDAARLRGRAAIAAVRTSISRIQALQRYSNLSAVHKTNEGLGVSNSTPVLQNNYETRL